MNCHRARQLISPYLDQQLTGREMLALQQHFSECESCEAERHSIRQVKTLLRSLHEPRPRTELQGAIFARLAESEQPWRFTLLTVSPHRPQRGRRLATALALSCMTVLSFAAACFAPAAHNGALASSGFFFPSGPTPVRTMPTDEASLSPLTDPSRPDFLSQPGTVGVRRERLFSSQGAAPPQPELRLSPLPDGSVPDYMQGQASFAEYRTR